MSMSYRRAWLCVPPLAMYLADVSITLLGQDECYWQGDHDAAIEHNPLAYPLLAWHPLLFIGLAVIWGALFSSVILFWRHRLAVVIAFFLTVSHAVGAASWLPRHGPIGWLGVIGVMLAARLLWTYTWHRFQPMDGVA